MTESMLPPALEAYTASLDALAVASADYDEACLAQAEARTHLVTCQKAANEALTALHEYLGYFQLRAEVKT